MEYPIISASSFTVQEMPAHHCEFQDQDYSLASCLAEAQQSECQSVEKPPHAVQKSPSECLTAAFSASISVALQSSVASSAPAYSAASSAPAYSAASPRWAQQKATSSQVSAQKEKTPSALVHSWSDNSVARKASGALQQVQSSAHNLVRRIQQSDERNHNFLPSSSSEGKAKAPWQGRTHQVDARHEPGTLGSVDPVEALGRSSKYRHWSVHQSCPQSHLHHWVPHS